MAGPSVMRGNSRGIWRSAYGHTPHIRRIGEEAKPCDAEKGHKPRRWVVERTLGWLNKCRALLVRYDKNWENYLGLLQFACGLLWFRRLYKLQPT